MKLKTKNAAKKPVNINKNNLPKKQTKGVVAKKEKLKEVVKPTVLKKEAEKGNHVDSTPSPHKLLQQELWKKAIENVSKMSNLSNEESSIVKLLENYKKKVTIPHKCTKLKNFITKGFSKFKDTNDELLQEIYEKLFSEFKAIGGNTENEENKKSESKKEASDDEEMVVDDENDDEDDDDDNEDDDDNIDDETESIEVGDSENDEEESEEEKPKAKVNKPNSKNGKNGSKFKGGKIQKNKKFNKKK